MVDGSMVASDVMSPRSAISDPMVVPVMSVVLEAQALLYWLQLVTGASR